MWGSVGGGGRRWDRPQRSSMVVMETVNWGGGHTEDVRFIYTHNIHDTGRGSPNECINCVIFHEKNSLIPSLSNP